MNFNTIDDDGFYNGRIHELAISDANRGSVVEASLPPGPLGQFERWRWVDGRWTSSIDYRGHAWYNPDATDEVHQATRFDDGPPAGWSYWVPGQNRIVSDSELASKQWRVVRASRDALLAESDWVVTKSVERGEPTPHDWVQYRQALRNITGQPDPFNIAWPIKPQNAYQGIFSVGSM